MNSRGNPYLFTAMSLTSSFDSIESILATFVGELGAFAVEVSFLAFFTIGYGFIVAFGYTKKGSWLNFKGKTNKGYSPPKENAFSKAIHRAASSGGLADVIVEWRACKSWVPVTTEALTLVAQAFLEEAPNEAISELIKHVQAYTASKDRVRATNAVLDVFARVNSSKMEDFATQASDLNIPFNIQTYETLLAGFAAAGAKDKVKNVFTQLWAVGQKPTARGFALVIRGLLKKGLIDSAVEHITEMKRQGFYAPPFAADVLFKTAVEKNRTEEILDGVLQYGSWMPLTSESVVVILEDCLKRDDVRLLRRVQKLAEKSQVPLQQNALESLVKVYAQIGDSCALGLFVTLQGSGRISEGTCVGILARCAESKNLRLTEEVMIYVRNNMKMTISLYSALMKVYAYSGMYDKACDIYEQIKAEGLEPDKMMYGCLMKFAVECGRTELSEELFKKTPKEVQNYMSLIRSAGRQRNVDGAFQILESMRQSELAVDLPAYNCVLDACVIAGEMKRARKLFEEMKNLKLMDLISYNTLLKGYCMSGDFKNAKLLFKTIEQDGFAPNDVSYNSLINCSVKHGSIHEAWRIVDGMMSAGINVDSFTLSTILKAVRDTKDPGQSKDLERALTLLASPGIKIEKDEVLLSALLDTLMRTREYGHLEKILQKFSDSDMRPNSHTSATLIKAFGQMKQVSKCWEVWRNMEERGVEPNEITCGCMLDALVCNGAVQDAFDILQSWKQAGRKANTIHYACLIKGFTATGDAARTLELLKEMRAENIVPNNVTYNALIDAQARDGNMKAIKWLVEQMENDNVSLDNVGSSIIVKGFCIKGNLEEAHEFFNSMLKRGIVKDAIVFNIMLDGCVRQERMDIADDLLAKMATYKIVPTNHTLTVIVKMWCRRKQLDKAFQVFQDFPRQGGFKPSNHAYTCLLNGCLYTQVADVDRAWKVLEEMKAVGCPPDAKTYSTFIVGLARLGECKQAVKLTEDFFGLAGDKKPLNKGASLECEALEQLLRSIEKRNLFQELAVPLLERLRAANAPVDPRIYSKSLQNAVAAKTRGGEAPWRTAKR